MHSDIAPAAGDPATSLLLQALLEQAPGWVVVLDQDFRLLLSNPAFDADFSRLYGQSALAVGDDMRASLANLPQAERAQLEQAWTAALQGQEYSFTCWLERSTGQPEMYQFDCSPLVINGARTACLLARRIQTPPSQDLQRAAELEAKVADLSQQLEQARSTLHELADHMPVIVWIQAQDLSLEYVNRRWRDYGGLSLQASRQGGWHQLVHPEDLPRINTAMFRANQSAELFEVECRIRRASDGAYRWHLARSVPYLSSQGRPERWYGTAVDIEDKVQDQARLEQIKADLEQVNRSLSRGLARFEGVISNLAEGLVLFDKDGRRLLLNPAARRLHGLPMGMDIFGKQGQITHGFEIHDLDGHLLPVARWPSSRALRGETFSGLELRLRRLDNGAEWIASYSGAPVLDEAGRQEYAVITFRDVSEERAAAQALRTAVQARDRFLSVASHELRTPLTTLVMQLQMTRRRIDPDTNAAPSPAELAKTFDIANRQTNRLAKLVDDLLDVSRSSLNKLDFHFQPMDLGALVTEVAGQFAPALEQAGCQLRLHLAEGVVGVWDAGRLEQVLGNLLSNAIKYAAGTEVQIDLSRGAERAVLQVRDHGPGIPWGSRDKIFDRYERYVADTAVTGLGLGLFLAREIVRNHCGTIELVQAEGPGACFIVTLPLKPMLP